MNMHSEKVSEIRSTDSGPRCETFSRARRAMPRATRRQPLGGGVVHGLGRRAESAGRELPATLDVPGE